MQIAHLTQQSNWPLSFLWLTSYLFGCIIWTKYFYIVLNCLIWLKAIMRVLHDVVLQIITNRFNYLLLSTFSSFQMVWNDIVKLLFNSVPSLSRNGWLPESKDQVSPEGENMAKLKTTLTSIFQKSFPGFLVYRKCCNLSEDKKDKLPSNSTSLHFRPDLISKLSNSANIEARERGAMTVPRCPLST